jgi:hypothetical protein
MKLSPCTRGCGEELRGCERTSRKLGRDENRAGTEAIAGCGVGLEREVGFFFFYFLFKASKQI